MAALMSAMLSTSVEVQTSTLQSAAVKRSSHSEPGSILVTITRLLPEGLWVSHFFCSIANTSIVTVQGFKV